jgi:putative membrane protein
MRRGLIPVACIIMIVTALMGCNSKKGNQMDENPAEAAETPGDLKRKNSQTNEEAAKNVIAVSSVSDTDFVTQAAEAGLTEVKLGKLARERGKQPVVREFGEMMVKDHTAANDELKSIAEKRGIKLPEESSCEACQKKYRDLNRLKGDAFDKKYIKMMIEGHRAVAEKFSKEASNGEDADLKAFATKTLRVINHHLDMVERMDGTPNDEPKK